MSVDSNSSDEESSTGSDESSSSGDDDFYCGKRSRTQFYYSSNTSSDEDYSDNENNIKKSKLNGYSSSSPTILILDSNNNTNNTNNLNNIKYSKYHDDKEIVMFYIKKYKSYQISVERFSNRLTQDKDIIIECAKKQIDILEYSTKLHSFANEIKNDREFAFQLFEYYGKGLKYFSNEIKNDRELVLLAMKNGGYLIDASEELQNDREIVLESFKHNKSNIEKCSTIFSNDRELMVEAIKFNGLSLEYAPYELKNDKEIVLQAVKQNPFSLKYASNELQNDREFIFQIFEQVESPWLILTNDNEHLISDAIDKFGTRVISTIINTLPKYPSLKIVKIDGTLLQYLSDEMKSDIEIVEQAINQNPFSIIYSNLNSKDKKKMISKVISKINDKYPTSSFTSKRLEFLEKLTHNELAFKLVKYNPLAIHNLHKCNNNRKVSFEATLIENGYWMKFTENHFQERIIHKYYGAKIENNENEINFYKNRNNQQLLWNSDYKWKLW